MAAKTSRPKYAYKIIAREKNGLATGPWASRYVYQMPRRKGRPGPWHHIPEHKVLDICRVGFHVMKRANIQGWWCNAFFYVHGGLFGRSVELELWRVEVKGDCEKCAYKSKRAYRSIRFIKRLPDPSQTWVRS